VGVRSLKPSRRALAIACALAGLCVAPASALGASPLAWSAPKLIDTQGPFGSTNEVESIGCPSSGLCVIGSFRGKVAISTDPSDGTSATAKWIMLGTPATGTVVGMSCPSTGLCVGIDDDGNALTSTNPTAAGGSTWSSEAVDTAGGGTPLDTIACPSTTLCVAGDQTGHILTTTDPMDGASATWTVKAVDSDGFFISGISCPSTTLCVAVDREGNALVSTDPADGATATWTVSTIVTFADPTKDRLQDVSCVPATTTCIAVSQQGSTYTSTDPAAATPTWTPDAVDAGSAIEKIACDAKPLCVIVDVKLGGLGASINALETTDPSDGAGATWSKQAGFETSPSPFFPDLPTAVSCAANQCVTGDSFGRTVTSVNAAAGDAVTWKTQSGIVGENRITGTSCPSTTLCAAVDNEGNVFTTADPGDGAGATWAETTVKTASAATVHFNAISCPTTSLCVAVDNSGNVAISTDPADGASATWKVASIDTVIIEAVSCASTTLCVATDDRGNVLTTKNPTAASPSWSTVDADGSGDVRGVSCIASPELCAAVDDTGNVLVSTDPHLGATATWTVSNIDGSNTMNGISCIAMPSEACFAIDGDGQVVSSTDPQDGASATWSTSSADSSSPLSAISCPDATLCVAVDQAGNAVTTTNPTDSAPTFTVNHGIDGASTQFMSVSCASAQLCLAGDNVGQVLTGIGHKLTVTIGGGGQGSVTSAPSGISCPSACATGYAAGTEVTLTATPIGTSTFTGWSGGGCSGTGTCTVTMDSDQDVTANFTGSETLLVTVGGAGTGKVTSSPTGISCPPTCSASYDGGTPVTLTAAAGAGSTFAGWSGGTCSGTTPTCNVTMDADKSVTATFVTNPTLTVTSTVASGAAGKVTSDTGGISCPSTCSHAYAPGTVVTLTAVPGTNSTFTGWSGGGCSGTSTCTVTMNADTAVTATFAVAVHTLTLSTGGTGAGKLTSSPAGISCPGTCSASFPATAKVTLTAVPDTGSTFAGWSGACTGTGACSVTMSADKAVTATFTASTGGGGGGGGTPSPPAAPTCTLKPDGKKVLIKAPGHTHREKSRAAAALRTLKLTATCDQDAALTLTGKVTSTGKRKHGKKPKARHATVHASGSGLAGQGLVLSVRLPASAVKHGAHVSVAFTLTASNVNGSASATASIRRLRLVG
jgi:hypothetical protein